MHGLDLAGTHALSPVPAHARHQLRRLLASAAWRGDVDAVVLAVHEALTNAHRHAGGVTWASACLQNDELLVEVCDAGPSFDPSRHTRRPPDLYAERGRGLWLISRVAEGMEVERQHGHNHVRLRFAP
jgi:anti-sigma regulatory factor (Ser/Thr protein kinase)